MTDGADATDLLNTESDLYFNALCVGPKLYDLTVVVPEPVTEARPAVQTLR